MPTYQIPESILGQAFFVPSSHDFFSIDSGGLPNGDDALIVQGNVNRNYKAFCEPPVVTPAIFTDPGSFGWAMTLWLKLGSHANLATASMLQSLLTLQLLDADESNPETTGGGASSFGMTTFCLLALGTSGVKFFRFGAGGFAPAWTRLASGNLPVNTWTMLTINISTATAGELYLNNNRSPAGTSGNGNWYSPGSFLYKKLCIGAYSDHANWNGREGEWRIAKLAFHDHQLNQTERSLLYHSMTD
jgi:hypothetical protein